MGLFVIKVLRPFHVILSALYISAATHTGESETYKVEEAVPDVETERRIS